MAAEASKKKKKPSFNQLNVGHKKRVKKSWRKPRGTHNKKRMKMKWAGAHPKVGYGNPESIRGLHPNGKGEVLVRNGKELEALKGKDASVRFSSALGARSRLTLLEKAKALGLKVLNSGKKAVWAKKAAVPAKKVN